MDFYVLLGVDLDSTLKSFVAHSHDKKWVGVDRGALFLIEQGISPYLSVGDFDSVSEEDRRLIESQSNRFVLLPQEKNYTDTEWALLEIFKRKSHARVHLYSESTSRLDHYLNTILMPAKKEFQAYAEQIHYYNYNNSLAYLLPGQHTVYKEDNKSIVAFASLTPIKNLSLINFEYPLENHNMDVPMVYTSNRFLAEKGKVSFDEGILMVIQTKKN